MNRIQLTSTKMSTKLIKIPYTHIKLLSVSNSYKLVSYKGFPSKEVHVKCPISKGDSFNRAIGTSASEEVSKT